MIDSPAAAYFVGLALGLGFGFFFGCLYSLVRFGRYESERWKREKRA